MPLKNSIKQLEIAGKNLNVVSDQYNDIVTEINEVLKKFNLGLATWLEVSSGGNYNKSWKESFGYARVSGKWGLSIKKETFENGIRETEDSWLFQDAPRYMRIEVINKLPDLIDEMISRTEDMTTKIVKKTNEATEYLQQLKEI